MTFSRFERAILGFKRPLSDLGRAIFGFKKKERVFTKPRLIEFQKGKFCVQKGGQFVY
jgi:hypothetical protein